MDDISVVLVERGQLFGELFLGGTDTDRVRDVAPEKVRTFSELEDDDWLLPAHFVGLLDRQKTGGEGRRFVRMGFVSARMGLIGRKGGRENQTEQQTEQIKDGVESGHSSAFANKLTNAERGADTSRAGLEHRVVHIGTPEGRNVQT